MLKERSKKNSSQVSNFWDRNLYLGVNPHLLKRE